MTVSRSGFSIEALTLPDEDLAEHQRLYNDWIAAYPCSDPIERGYIEQAFTALIEKRRIERRRATLRADRIRTAELFFEHEQEDRLHGCMAPFNADCEGALIQLLRFAKGCRWAIEIWEDLQAKLTDHGTWYGISRVCAIQLLGLNANIKLLFYSEEAYLISLDCLVAQANPKQATIDKLLDPWVVPHGLLERDVKLWPGNPAESRARLQAIVDRELPRLRAREETLRVQYEEPARAAAKAMALASLVREELPLLRAERMHESSYDRAVAAYRKVRKQNATAPVPGAERREFAIVVPDLGPTGDAGLGGNQGTSDVGSAPYSRAP